MGSGGDRLLGELSVHIGDRVGTEKRAAYVALSNGAIEILLVVASVFGVQPG